jgi:RNA polymerase sigma-70 factor, ECF subfamily
VRAVPHGSNRTGAAPRPLSAPDRDRFERLVLVHLDAAFNLARYLVRDPDDAEDVVQEACMRAMRYFASFRGVNGRAWLLAIVRKTCYTLLERRRDRLAASEFDEELHSPEPGMPEPEAQLSRALATEAVRRAVDALPLVFRETVVLRELEGLSYKEIADVTDVPVGTVMSRLARARGLLERALAQVGGEV